MRFKLLLAFLVSALLSTAIPTYAQATDSWEIIYVNWTSGELIQVTEEGETVIGTIPPNLEGYRVVLSPNRRFLAFKSRIPDSGGYDPLLVANVEEGTCCLDLETLNRIEEGGGYLFILDHGVFSPDSRYFAAADTGISGYNGNSGRLGNIVTFDVEAGQRVQVLPGAMNGASDFRAFVRVRSWNNDGIYLQLVSNPTR